MIDSQTTEITKPSIMDLQKILEAYDFIVENVGGRCPKCGRYYKVHFYEEKTIEEVIKKRFQCRDCAELARQKTIKELGFE